MFAKVGSLLITSLLIIVYFSLSGCASSEVSRDAESNIDLGVQNARNLVAGPGSNLADAYGNSSQATKGALIGGATGAIWGYLTPAIGFLPGAAVGAIFGASYGSYIDANTTLLDQLENRGATVVMLGDQILIAIPSARIFDPESAHVKPDAYSTLYLIARYVNQYVKMLVKINVYTNSTGSPAVDLALSQQQANILEKYLIATGIDARLLYAVGCGGSHPVVRNSLAWDNDNYRIEITLEKLYV